MTQQIAGGTLTLADDLVLTRMGYGAMQLAGPGVFGPPKDRAEAVAVLREAVELGITHIDTSDFYGPHVTNEIIKEALHPYPEQVRLVTKVGARRDDKGNWLSAHSPAELVQAVHDNLDRLGVDAIDVVNYRVHGGDDPSGTSEGSIAEEFGVLAELQGKGLIKHLGVSTVTAAQLAEAQTIAPVVCVQNMYNIADRRDDALIELCEAAGIAYVPYFPLGGFSPLQSQVLDEVAESVGATSRQVALAWLLQRSPQILLIPGTSSREHLRENVAAASITLPAEAVDRLDAV